MLDLIINYFVVAYQINPITQIIGFIAFILWIIAFLNKDDNKAKSIHLLSLFLWVVHYYLFHLYTWLACDLLWWFRNFASIKFNKNNKTFIVFIFFYIIIWVFIFDNVFSLFPIFSWILASIAFFYLDWIKMRFTLLLTCIFWLIYNYTWNSLGWIITDLFFIGVHIITITRLFFDKKIKINKIKMS